MLVAKKKARVQKARNTGRKNKAVFIIAHRCAKCNTGKEVWNGGTKAEIKT